MKGIKSKENCYLWVPQEKCQTGIQTRMLHTRLEHQVTSKGLELLHIDSADYKESTSRGCFFLESNLISWFSKKQNCVSLSTAEAEYISASSSCSQLVWMKQMLNKYNVEQDVLTFYCNNLS